MRTYRRAAGTAAALSTVLLSALLTGACGDGGRWASARPSTPVRGTGGSSAPADPAAEAARIAGTLPDEDLVGQVLMPFAYGTDATKVSSSAVAKNKAYAGVSTPAEMVAKYRLGGLILVDWSGNDPTAKTNATSNIESTAQVRQFTAGLQQAARATRAGLPMLIGTDQEYGVVTRVRSGMVQLPAAMAFGAAADPALTEGAWKAAGTELAALGVNVDFAPDADTLGPAGSGVIGSRSFGSDPAVVGKQVAAAVRGLQGAGVAATIKHFPGHGHTPADSHEGLPVVSLSGSDVRSQDLPPFQAGIAADTWLVMSGHLNVTALDPGQPASYSKKILVDLLRTELGFKGVVVSDALNMAGAKRGSTEQSAVDALLAGNDLLLMPANLAAAQRGLLDALHAGTLPRERLVEAATRVLALRARLAGFPQPAASVLDSADDRAPVARAAAAAVTVLRGACTGPLVKQPVTVTASGGRDQARGWLAQALTDRGVRVVPSGGTVVHLVGYGDGAGDLSPAAAVTVAMDTPYVLRQAQSPTLVATYSSTKASMEALAATLAGKAGAPGHSPVAVSGLPRSSCTG